MGTNIRSNHWLANMVLPGMAGRGEGSVTVVSSIAGLRGSTSIGAYGISKAADMQLVRNLACEWGPRGVRANCIVPGLVRTDFAKALWEDPENLRRRTRDTPLQRIGEPDEIAGAAVFLAAASGRFMTGQTIVIDGGGHGGVACGGVAAPGAFAGLQVVGLNWPGYTHSRKDEQDARDCRGLFFRVAPGGRRRCGLD